MEHTPEFIDKTRKLFETSLNEHGYSFQQSILKKVTELFSQSKSGWFPEAAEFPVEVRGRGTRIDFVLRRIKKRHATWNEEDGQTTLMVAECKRANPAYANWCFAKSPYSFGGRNINPEPLVFEGINSCSESIRNTGHYNVEGVGRCNAICSHKLVYDSSKNVYHIAIEVKHDAKGNVTSSDSGKDAVESAASQLCLGLNGIVHFLALNATLWEQKSPVTLLPVIFTTANLWVSNAELNEADLKTGDLSFRDHKFEQVPWLFFQYHLSPSIKHKVPSESPKENSLADILQADYVRTIPIISPTGIEEFLSYATALNLIN